MTSVAGRLAGILAFQHGVRLKTRLLFSGLFLLLVLIGLVAADRGPGVVAAAGTFEFTGPEGLGIEGVSPAELWVRRSDTSGAASVQCVTNPGLATPGVDYDDAVATAVFAAGDEYAKCVIAVYDDSEAEAFEDFTVVLDPGNSGGLGEQASVWVRIVDDDGLGNVEVSVSPNPVYENGGPVVVSVMRTGDLRGGIIVRGISIIPGTASQSDFQGGGWDFFFHEGDSFRTGTIPIVSDGVAEGSEVFSVVTTPSSGNWALTSPEVIEVEILDSEMAAMPQVASVQPTAVPSDAVRGTIYGAGFVIGAMVELSAPGGSFLAPAGGVLPTQMVFDFGNQPVPSGQYELRVINPSGEPAESNAVEFTVFVPPAVSITQVTPDVIAANRLGSPVVVIGEGFQPGALVRVTGNSRSYDVGASFISTNEVRFWLGNIVPPLEPGEYELVVRNAPWVGGMSDPVPLMVSEALSPTVSSAFPSSAPANGIRQILLTGTGFQAAVSVEVSGPGGFVAGAGVEILSDTELLMTLDAWALPAGASGTYQLRVMNYGELYSDYIDFEVLPAAAPLVTSINQGTVDALTPFVLQIKGSGFLPGAWVQALHDETGAGPWLGSAEVQDPETLVVSNQSGVALAGGYTVRVINPGQDAPASNSLPFTVAPTAAPPVLGSLNPPVVAVPDSSQSSQTWVDVAGSGFAPGMIPLPAAAQVLWCGWSVESDTLARLGICPGMAPGDYEARFYNPGSLASNSLVLRIEPTTPPALTHPTTISAGGSHSLALDEDGELWLWGSDLSGQLPWPRPLRPHLYTFPAQLASLDGGGYYSMGMTATGDVWTWGYDAYGQMGDGPGGGAAPFNVPFQAPALAVSAGSSHSFALLADGTLWAWGVNDRGQLGLGYATPYPSDPLGVESPQLVALTDVVAIAAAEGGAHTLALKSDGTVWGWGEPTAILTSPPGGGWPFEPIVAPQQVPGLTGVTAIAAAGYRSLALKSDGTVWQWDAWGGLQQVQGLPVDIVAITAGPSSAHALTSTGEVYGWGNNHRGSVGDGTFDPRPTAVQLSLPGPVVQISDGGGDHSLALLADGRIFAWGANGAGVLGIGTEVDTPSPTQVLFGPSDTVTCSGEQWPTRYPFSISCSSDLAPGSGPVTWTAVGLTPGTQNGTSVSFATALPEDDPLPASWPVVIEASWTDPQGNPRTVTMPRTVESPASCSGGQTTSVFCSFVVGGTFGTWSATGFSPEYSENSWQEFTRQPFTSGTITATFAGRQQVFEFPWDAPPPPVKRVFLAWAGQRVILEHDWRTPPGDAADVEPNGSCPFAGPTPIRYVKGSGPGNFLPALGASIDWESDPITAVVEVSAGSQQLPSQVPSDPQGACISRVLYESEDQGQVDIEAFPDPGDPQAPKVAFVIFYMKLESVALSLEASVAKPSVNATNGDFAPGNPWAPSSGAVTVTRNISTDLLVRGRVKGFFTNNNPSGRPGTSNLPPDRWVMPDDWALLAGGPADPADGSDAIGTAEQFRPYYDIMSAPNSGLVCLGLEGLCMERPIGEDTVSEVPGPFVGPYSVLDIPGISSAAFGSSQPFSIRETILRDGDIDMWDAPMPPALVSVDIRGAGYLRQVRKQDVYYLGDPDMLGPGQSFPNLFYRSNIPDSPFIPAVVPGGGYFWDSWGNDGPGGNGQGAHEFWTPVLVGVDVQGASDPTLTQDDLLELDGIAAAAGDSTIARTLVVYSDNHGEFMVAANGKFKAASGSCEPSPVAGTSTITAVADYPDFRGKHFTVASNVATVTWTPDAVSIASLSPGTVVAGSENVELTLTGSGFVPGVSQVCLNGAPLSTTVSSSTEATAVLPGPAAATTYQVRVANATAGGGASNVLVLLGTVQPTSVSEIAVVTNDDPEETVTVSTPPPQPEAPPVITVETSAGTGTVAVAIYETNPGETPTFAIGSGGETGTFVDAYVSPTSTFTSTIIVICDPNGGDVAYWWDGAAWSPASDQSFDANTGCITVTVTPDTSPDIADLSGTIFAAALGYAPVIQSVSATPELVPVGSAVTASVAFADRDLPQDAHTATWNWGDGSMSQGPAGTAATHQYLLPGVYTVSVSVTDSDGATASTSFRYVVVYDPGGGFVTGGGWIDSPAGAYAADPTLTGKATFGFVSQYKKGATVPTGKTEFQFQAGALNFKSTSYEWLVVAGAKAQFRGQGTINGQGDYAFFVTAIDGDSDGDKKPDKFRIRIWDRLIGGLVYDNQLNAPDDADPTTVLGGGSIVVHR